MIILQSLAKQKWRVCFESEILMRYIQCLCLSKIPMLTPNPQSDQFRDGRSLRRDWFVMTEFCELLREVTIPSRPLPSTMLGFREVPSMKNEPSPHTESSGTLIFTFTASRIMDNVYKCLSIRCLAIVSQRDENNPLDLVSLQEAMQQLKFMREDPLLRFMQPSFSHSFSPPCWVTEGDKGCASRVRTISHSSSITLQIFIRHSLPIDEPDADQYMAICKRRRPFCIQLCRLSLSWGLSSQQFCGKLVNEFQGDGTQNVFGDSSFRITLRFNS